MDNLTQHFSHQPTLTALFIISLVLVAISVPYFIQQQKRYGSLFDFASRSRKNIAGTSCVVLVGIFLYGLTPYVAPPTDELAIVLGNTQNTPKPKISGDIAEAIEGSMLQHKGDDVEEMADSIKIVSAVGKPEVINRQSVVLKTAIRQKAALMPPQVR